MNNRNNATRNRPMTYGQRRTYRDAWTQASEAAQCVAALAGIVLVLAIGYIAAYGGMLASGATPFPRDAQAFALTCYAAPIAALVGAFAWWLSFAAKYKASVDP